VCTRAGEGSEIDAIGAVVLQRGDVVGQHHTGGGGYGDPLEREPERVQADVLAGFDSFERAREVYGDWMCGRPREEA
jgi:N-methylhydantoinase B